MWNIFKREPKTTNYTDAFIAIGRYEGDKKDLFEKLLLTYLEEYHLQRFPKRTPKS